MIETTDHLPEDELLGLWPACCDREPERAGRSQLGSASAAPTCSRGPGCRGLP